MAGQDSSILSAIFNKHTLIHGAMMLGMIFTPVAAVAASVGTTATFGDLGLAAFDMLKSMVTGFADGGVVADAFRNAAEGHWAADSYHLGAHDMATHSAHAALGSPPVPSVSVSPPPADTALHAHHAYP